LQPEPEPHHVGAFHATNNDAALVLASTPILPKLHIEKSRVDVTFLIFYYVGQRIGVGAGARTGAASRLRVRHEKIMRLRFWLLRGPLSFGLFIENSKIDT
jgi:hypothetical protein